jgi:hypothetical protein
MPKLILRPDETERPTLEEHLNDRSARPIRMWWMHPGDPLVQKERHVGAKAAFEAVLDLLDPALDGGVADLIQALAAEWEAD